LNLMAAIAVLGQARIPVESGPNPFLADANGKPLYLQQNYVAEGNPYFRDQYYFAELTTFNGKVYRDVQVKVNLMENQVLYLTEDKKEMISTSIIKRIKFYSIPDADGSQHLVLESFNGGLNIENTPIYQVLDSGTYILLKRIVVNYRDIKGYGQSTITRTFEHLETFYCRMPDGSISKLNKGKEALLEIFGKKRNLVEAFIDKNNLKCRTAKDFQKVFSYANSIF
jgi:hypothetical protein